MFIFSQNNVTILKKEVSALNICDIIRKKRDGGELTAAEIEFFVKGAVDRSIPDYQLSALLMAVFLRSMTDNETALLTDAMARSGDTVDLSCFGDLSVDKHSTGGVGDKTTLIVAPIVASLGGKVAKMSGRGLGHTGGTVDKLESVPGFRTELSPEEFTKQTEKTGLAVIGQAKDLAPADKVLYALRDVTETVDSIPLIVSSIMSKKLAAGSRSIVLDVKVGSGAFMKTADDARRLAEGMVTIGRRCGRKVRAVLTNMNMPLGKAVGNALEVAEAVEVLSGNGPDDLTEVCTVLASEMLSLCLGISTQEAALRVKESIRSGAALAKMKEWISAQGGDVCCIEDASRLPVATHSEDIVSRCEGYLCSMDAEKIGRAATVLGAGRRFKEDTIDHAAGIMIHKKTGDFVRKGEPLCTLLTNRPESIEAACNLFLQAVGFSAERPAHQPLIIDRV